MSYLCVKVKTAKFTTELKFRLPGTRTKKCRELAKQRVIYKISKKILRKYSYIYQQYFVNIILEMSYITLYFANFWFHSQVAGTKFRRVRRP